MNAEEHIVELRSIIKRFEEEYVAAVASAANARKAESRALESVKEAENLLAKRTEEVAASILALDGELGTERAAVAALRAEKQNLLDKSAQLKVDNARLEDENMKYRVYETQANKVLDAKDESLKARAKEITETEILLANKASFLPKTD